MKFKALIFLVGTLVSGQLFAQTTNEGPMDLQRFRVLEKAAQNPANGYWAKVAFQAYKEGLFDGLLHLEGNEFCFSAPMKTARMDDIFRQLALELEIATRKASPSTFVSILLAAQLSKKYPCNR